MPADEVTRGTDVDGSRARTGPRHAAPRKPLFTRFHMPAGKAIASVAMPTAVLMGMGFTSTFALADNNGSPSPSTSAKSLTADEYKDCVKALDEDKDASASPSPSASPSTSASPSQTAGSGKTEEPGGTSSSGSGSDDKATPDPTATSDSGSSGSDSGSSGSGSGSAGSDSGSTGSDSGSAGSGSGSGGDTDTPSTSQTQSGGGGVLDTIGDTLGDLLTGGGGTDTGSGASTQTATPAPTASPSSSSSSATDTSSGGGKDAAGKDTGGSASDTVKDTAKKATDTVKDTAGDTTGTVSKTADDTTRAAGDATATATPSPSASESASAEDCPVATDDEGGVDNKVPVADDPWYLNASSLLLKGADYQGIVQVKTANGTTKKVLKYVISGGTDIGDLHQTVNDKQANKTYHVQAAKGSTSTITGGDTVMYTESISGNLFGLIPVTFSPDSPPPLNIPLIYFTNVKVVQAAQFGGNLHVPGMHVYTTD
ncbi:hypothetical protein [Streptomyces cinerochromogenes]|uniref:hypothetical protein n=1 Tax=Streptomyces cinerochromogenes TaxID=66422 RepID=UPI001670D910|nr:hypothetical protein [Streptomyces cinerochromogenes]GGS97155.1 hypothetical protein GCM10010206_69850 [Streptomyces cinerochromogenes]